MCNPGYPNLYGSVFNREGTKRRKNHASYQVGMLLGLAEKESYLVGMFPGLAEKESYLVGMFPGLAEKESYIVGMLPGLAEKESYIVGMLPGLTEKESYIVGMFPPIACTPCFPFFHRFLFLFTIFSYLCVDINQNKHV